MLLTAVAKNEQWKKWKCIQVWSEEIKISKKTMHGLIQYNTVALRDAAAL